MKKPIPTELIDPNTGIQFPKDSRTPIRINRPLSAYARELKEVTKLGGIVMGGMTVGRLQNLFGIYLPETEPEVMSGSVGL